MSASPEQAAQDILDVVPLVMRGVRQEMRSGRADDLSVPQFRTLAFLNRNRGASLSQVADHMGLTLPSASKMIEVLVERQLVVRESSPLDRRRISLSLTPSGLSVLESAVAHTRHRLAQMLARLSESERDTIRSALAILRPIFTPDAEAASAEPREESERAAAER